MTLSFDILEAPASPLTRIDARWKLAALAPAMLAVAFLQTWPAIAGALAATVVLLAAARLPRRFVVPRLGAFVFFLAPFLIILPLVQGWDASVTAARVAGRAGAIFLLGLVLAGTSPLPRTLHAARSLGMPRLFGQIGLLTYRYIFVLTDEFFRLRTALWARGFRNRANRHSYRTVGSVAGTLLVRGVERAGRVAQAMRCRGFDGHLHTLTEFRTRAADVLFFAAVLGTAAGALAWDLWLRS